MNPNQEKMDYQKTLNLPQTEFSMRAGLVQKEPEMLARWKEQDLYGRIKKKSAGKPSYVLHDGPPYANGNIHMGHALNKILKDLIVKYKTMKGFNSHYIPGWDCHGLPIEHQLLKELKQKKDDVDCVEFRKKAHDYAMKYVGIQSEQFQRLGVFGEWDHPYLTLDPQYEHWILKSLASLHKDGYIYRGLKPVNWCFQCETALAEAEVEYENHVSPSVYVKFEVNNREALKGLPDKKLSLLIWTTTPWTLVANVAVALDDAFTYACVDLGEEMILVETSLAPAVLAKGGKAPCKTVKEFKGAELTALTYAHPIGTIKQGCVVAADYVTKEDGTGLVHTAPGHGQDDYATGVKYKLDILMPVDDRGIYTKEAGSYAGEHVFKANSRIIEDLKQKGTLFATEDVNHSYPHCWRCKKPIIFRATHQWFLSVDHQALRQKLVTAIKNDIEWIPESGKERILGMVTGRPDWCLSRQRYWGVPIPALKPKAGDESPRLYQEVINHFAEIVKTEGTNAWFEKDVKELVPPGFTCPETGATAFEKTHDILDVWFDSGVSHQAVAKAMMGLDLPVDMYLEGSDQHRGWFQSSLIPAVAIEKKPPYKHVLTHGFVVDGQGFKMSKSTGNVISPLDVMKQSGADILRLWVASSSYNEDIRLSKEILDRLSDAYRKIRNTFRYLLGNLNGFDPDQDQLPYEQLLPLDQWALHRLAATMSSAQGAFDRFEFAKVYKTIYTFCNEDLSSFYLDILKDRLYTSASSSRERRSAQTVLYHIVNHVIRITAPILCFTAEEIFQLMPREAGTCDVKSVHLLEILAVPKEWNNPPIHDDFDTLVRLRPYVMKALEDKRRDGNIGSSLEASVLFTTSSERDFKYLAAKKDLLPAVFIVSQADVKLDEHVQNGINTDFPKTMITINQARGHKCGRCWNYKEDVGQDKQYETLCNRCLQIVKEYT